MILTQQALLGPAAQVLQELDPRAGVGDAGDAGDLHCPVAHRHVAKNTVRCDGKDAANRGGNLVGDWWLAPRAGRKVVISRHYYHSIGFFPTIKR